MAKGIFPDVRKVMLGRMLGIIGFSGEEKYRFKGSIEP
jgi:hypothetical protein